MLQSRLPLFSVGHRVESRILNAQMDALLSDLLELDGRAEQMSRRVSRVLAALGREQEILASRLAQAQTQTDGEIWAGIESMVLPQDGRRPAAIDELYGHARLPWAAPPVSRLIFRDAQGQGRLLGGYHVETDPPTSDSVQDEGRPEDALVSDGALPYWREVVTPASQAGPVELSLTFPVPSELSPLQDANFFILHPFPAGGVDLVTWGYRSRDEVRPFPDWETVHPDIPALAYSCRVLALDAVTIHLRSTRGFPDGEYVHYHLGLRSLQVLQGPFAEQAYMDMVIDLPPGLKRLTHAVVVLANPLALQAFRSGYPWVSLNYESYLGETRELSFGELPADVQGTRLVIRVQLSTPDPSGPTPLFRGVRLGWTLLG